MAQYTRDPRVMTSRFDTVCAETGKPIKKGEDCVYYPAAKKVYRMDSNQAEEYRKWKANTDKGAGD